MLDSTWKCYVSTGRISDDGLGNQWREKISPEIDIED